MTFQSYLTLNNPLFHFRGSLVFFLFSFRSFSVTPDFSLSAKFSSSYFPLLYQPALVSILPIFHSGGRPVTWTELSQRYDAQVERALEGRHSSLLPYLAARRGRCGDRHLRTSSEVFSALTRYIQGIFTLAANRASELRLFRNNSYLWFTQWRYRASLKWTDARTNGKLVIANNCVSRDIEWSRYFISDVFSCFLKIRDRTPARCDGSRVHDK